MVDKNFDLDLGEIGQDKPTDPIFDEAKTKKDAAEALKAVNAKKAADEKAAKDKKAAKAKKDSDAIIKAKKSLEDAKKAAKEADRLAREAQEDLISAKGPLAMPTLVIMNTELQMGVPVPGHPKLEMSRTFKRRERVTNPRYISLLMSVGADMDVVEV